MTDWIVGLLVITAIVSARLLVGEALYWLRVRRDRKRLVAESQEFWSWYGQHEKETREGWALTRARGNTTLGQLCARVRVKASESP